MKILFSSCKNGGAS